MADLSDPNIETAYESVRSDKDPLNWLLLDYSTETKADKIVLTDSGTGGLDEFKTKLDDAKASFGYVRVEYANDQESKRSKFIFVVWIGQGVKVMRKAKVSVQAADVKKVIRAFSLDVPANTKDDLEEEPIVTRLRKAGGASYDKV